MILVSLIIRSFVRPSVPSFIHSLTHSLTHLNRIHLSVVGWSKTPLCLQLNDHVILIIHSFAHSFIHLFIHAFIHWQTYRDWGDDIGKPLHTDEQQQEPRFLSVSREGETGRIAPNVELCQMESCSTSWSQPTHAHRELVCDKCKYLSINWRTQWLLSPFSSSCTWSWLSTVLSSDPFPRQWPTTLEQSTCRRPVCQSCFTHNISSETENTFISAIIPRPC